MSCTKRFISPFVRTVADTIVRRSENNAEFTLLAFFHLVLRSAVGESVVADNHGIALFPLDGETVVIHELSPELPVVPLNVGVVTVGHLDGTELRLELTNTRPGVEPGEVVSDVSVRDVHVVLREVFECRSIVLGLHEARVAREVNSPLYLQSTRFSQSLGFLGTVGAETLLPVVPDLPFLVRVVSSLSVGKISPVAEALVLESVAKFRLHELLGHAIGVRKVGSATQAIVEDISHAERNSLDGLTDVGHLVVVVQICLARGSSFIKVGLEFTAVVATSYVLRGFTCHNDIDVGLEVNHFVTPGVGEVDDSLLFIGVFHLGNEGIVQLRDFTLTVNCELGEVDGVRNGAVPVLGNYVGVEVSVDFSVH